MTDRHSKQPNLLTKGSGGCVFRFPGVKPLTLPIVSHNGGPTYRFDSIVGRAPFKCILPMALALSALGFCFQGLPQQHLTRLADPDPTDGLSCDRDGEGSRCPPWRHEAKRPDSNDLASRLYYLHKGGHLGCP